MGADGRNVTSISQSRNISAFVPAWSTVFRESSIELGSVAPSSVVNPEDAVQIIGGRPVIGSENTRRHARRKVREPRPPQRPLSFPPISRHKCLQFSVGQAVPSAILTSSTSNFQLTYPAETSTQPYSTMSLRFTVGRASVPVSGSLS